jgi:hypothetical protein
MGGTMRFQRTRIKQGCYKSQILSLPSGLETQKRPPPAETAFLNNCGN